MSRWFRHYAGMMRDDKLVGVAVRSKQPVERVLWVWGAILESAAEINDGGRFEFDAGEAAYFLRCEEDDIRAVVDQLAAVERIVDGVVARWGDRQFDSDASRERQRRYRERKQKGRNAEVPEVQDNAHSGGSDVTPPSRDAEVTAQDTETETDNRYSEPIGSDAGASAPPVSYIDARAELFGEGKPALLAMGVPPRQTGSVIGGWLKQTGDDCRRVLDAIQRARDKRVVEPIAWISAQLGSPRGRNVESSSSPAIQAIDDMLTELRGGGGARADEGSARQLRQR